MTELVVTGVAYLAGKTGKKEVGDAMGRPELGKVATSLDTWEE